MAAYFLSDVHLRLDHPERCQRLADWVDTLRPDDDVTVVGDLCDFWFTSRQASPSRLVSRGLEALAAFHRRGGRLTILAGNHDAQLASLYRGPLGARFETGSIDVEVFGLRIHAVHGHLLGARPAWKALMEGRGFLHAFGALPTSIAGAMEARLERSNLVHKVESDRRFLAVYRDYARTIAEKTDLVVFGHIHLATDQPELRPRLVVLGDWTDGGMSYLKVDDSGAVLVVHEPLSTAIEHRDGSA